jgi:hypothetical protein
VSAGWRLFECFKERILRILVHEICMFNECNSATSFNREKCQAGGKGADLINFDRI